jgi:hypothetical protein
MIYYKIRLFIFSLLLVFSFAAFSQLSKVSIAYNTGKLYHDISQFNYAYYDFLGGLNAGAEFHIHKKWSIGVLYSNFYLNRLLPKLDKQVRIYHFVTDDLFSLTLNRKQKINKKFEWIIGLEPTLRYSFVAWADAWTFDGIETIVLSGGHKEIKDLGLKFSTSIRYNPLKNERLTIDLYAKRSAFQNTPNFSQFGLGFGYAFYKKK